MKETKRTTNRAKLLEVNQVTKQFTKGQGLVKSTILAVNNVSFALDSNTPEIFTLAGESGAASPLLPS